MTPGRLSRAVPRPRPIDTVDEDTPLLWELPSGFIWFQYSMSPVVGRQFWLDPIFWQGPATNAWFGTRDGRLPEGTAEFASSEQARAAMAQVVFRRPPDVGESDREERLRQAAETLLQHGGVDALRAELRHERALTNPGWAAAVQRRIDVWTGGSPAQWCWAHGHRMARCLITKVRFGPCDPRDAVPPAVYMRSRGA